MTEGFDLAFLLILLGALLRLRADRMRPAVGLGLFIGLLGGMLTRHASIMFTTIPLAWAISVWWWSGRHAGRAGWVAALMVVVVVGGAAVSAKLLTHLACAARGDACISIIGRAGVYRIYDAYRLVPMEQRDDWVQRLEATAPNDEIARVLGIMATTPSPWVGVRDAIAAEPALAGRAPDALMNEGFWRFARFADWWVLKQWGRELFRAVFGTGGDPCHCTGHGCRFTAQATRLLTVSANSIAVVFPPEDLYSVPLLGTGAEHPESADQYMYLAEQPAIRWLAQLHPLLPGPRALLLGVTLALALAAIRVGRRPELTAWFGSLWIGATAYVLALTFTTVTIPRYLAPLDLMLWSSNALALVVLIHWAVGGRGCGLMPPPLQEE